MPFVAPAGAPRRDPRSRAGRRRATAAATTALAALVTLLALVVLPGPTSAAASRSAASSTGTGPHAAHVTAGTCPVSSRYESKVVDGSSQLFRIGAHDGRYTSEQIGGIAGVRYGAIALDPTDGTIRAIADIADGTAPTDAAGTRVRTGDLLTVDRESGSVTTTGRRPGSPPRPRGRRRSVATATSSSCRGRLRHVHRLCADQRFGRHAQGRSDRHGPRCRPELGRRLPVGSTGHERRHPAPRPRHGCRVHVPRTERPRRGRDDDGRVHVREREPRFRRRRRHDDAGGHRPRRLPDLPRRVRGPIPTDPGDGAVTCVSGEADLEVSTSGPDTTEPNAPVTWTVEVRNVGSTPSSGWTMRRRPPGGLLRAWSVPDRSLSASGTAVSLPGKGARVRRGAYARLSRRSRRRPHGPATTRPPRGRTRPIPLRRTTRRNSRRASTRTRPSDWPSRATRARNSPCRPARP